MDKAEVKYGSIKDRLKLKGNSKVEYPILSLKESIEELKDMKTVTKTKYVVPGKVSGWSFKIHN